MRQAISLALTLVSLGFPSRSVATACAPAQIVTQAKSLMANGDYAKAVNVLEDALAEAGPSDRPAMIDLLRQSYRNLISQAEAAGRARDAADYRDNLAILDRTPSRPQALTSATDRQAPKPASKPVEPPAIGKTLTPEPEPRPLPRSAIPPDQGLIPEPAPVPDPGGLPPLDGPSPPASPPRTKVSPQPRAAGEVTSGKAPLSGSKGRTLPGQTESSAPGVQAGDIGQPGNALAEAAEANPAEAPSQAHQTAPSSGSGSGSELTEADRLFTEKKYEEAGRSYARLAASNRLPAERKPVWAYCRWVAVVARINAPPSANREWDEIDQEVRSIQRLTPGNWYGEYLINRVAEARRGGRSSTRGGRLVVRGSNPDEPEPRKLPHLLGRGRSAPSPAPASPAGNSAQPLGLPPAESTQAAPGDQSAAQGSTDPAVPDEGIKALTPNAEAAPTPVAWHVRETTNFRVHHTDAVLAEKAALAAESVRTQQARRWGSSATRTAWTPRCDIYLYPTPRDFARETGQPETSPGFSTMGINANRVTARRVNLRADHPQVLSAILPHEVTHVVLADLFKQQQIPRWADEGMAVLAEPLAEQLGRAADLSAPLDEGRVFKLSELMAIDYPSAEAWSLYYAQSVSVTQFLVELGSPEQFITFIHNAQRQGIELALREVYHLEGYKALEQRWLTFARRQSAEISASRSGSNKDLELTRRQ
jgi:hypothetical protein